MHGNIELYPVRTHMSKTVPIKLSEESQRVMIKPTRNRTIWMSIGILALLILGVSQLLARPATRIDPLTVEADNAIDERMIMVVSNESPFQPNSLCASCHMEIHGQWVRSVHYQAWREPIFQAMYNNYQQYMNSDEMYVPEEQIVEEEDLSGRELRRQRWNVAHTPEEEREDYEVPIFNIPDQEGEISTQVHGDGLMEEGIYDGKIHVNCMKCHAPGADFTKDADLYLENNIDGVFCDYCHTVVDYTPTEGYVIFWGHIKQGPRPFATTSSHAIEYNRLYEESTYCSGCHQYDNPWGFPVYNTYDEWFQSDYNNPANPVNCQDCHMPTYPGRPSLRGDWRPDVADHSMGGGHNYDFMLESAEVDFTTDIQGDELYIDADVTSHAGHNYPSSNGMRQLILIVRLKGSAGETLWEGKRVYERVLGDRFGNMTLEPWSATQVLMDTTLLPGETRTESFVTALPDTDDTLYVTAQLFYRLTPEDTDVGTDYTQAPFRVDFATEFLQ